MSNSTFSSIVGVVALVLALVTLLVVVLIFGSTPADRIPPNDDLTRSLALTYQPISDAFVRSVALIGQNPIGHVAASGPLISQSVFPGETLARSLALTN
jgi:hypothetical protein